MAARRLLIVMLLLLGISSLGAWLIPSQRLERARTTTTTESAPPDDLPRGGLVTATIRVGGRKLPVVEMRLGQQLILRVRADLRDDVEVPGLGLVEAVDPVTPARFDLLPTEPGRYPVRLVQGNRTVARIDVAAAHKPPSAKIGNRRPVKGGRKRASG